jgi:uracil-DNA glycosylase
MNKEKFKDKFEEGWWDKLNPIFETNILESIYSHLKQRGADRHIIYPTADNTFRAFKECPYRDLKVVIVGMEPYANEINKVPQADGLAFSSSLTNIIQPSLDKFYEGMGEDLGEEVIKVPNLEYLANSGVLLLNYSLTVEKQKISSHTDIALWEPFHQYLIEEVLNKYNPGLIYYLLGKHAQKLEKYILPFNNYVFKAYHPSYYVKRETSWETNGFFKKSKTILKQNNGIDFDWNPITPF